MKKIQTIGIIGGLGPNTTALFYLNIVKGYKQKMIGQMPKIIISNVPLPAKVEMRAITRNRYLKRCLTYLINEAKRLEKASADFIVMPCNSLHMFEQQIKKSVSIPFVSIINETTKYLKNSQSKIVGLLSTLSTAENKLYEDCFIKNGIKYISTTKQEQ